MKNPLKSPKVAVFFTKAKTYPLAPFNPKCIYPEFDNQAVFITDIDKKNEVYDSVRSLFVSLEYDKKNIGTKKWNPLKNEIKKGGKVVIKPNLVFDKNPHGDEGVIAQITHASIVRPIIDYVLLATDGDATITICDCPVQTANWDRLTEISGMKELVKYYELINIKIDLIDLRYEIADQTKEGAIIKRNFMERDPKGYVRVDLKEKSELNPVIDKSSLFEITNYPLGTVSKHHNMEKNEYNISKTVLESNLFINCPKLKSHRKAGMTFALKNLIGINGNKSWLAHHRKGSPDSGGDEYNKISVSSIKSRAGMIAKQNPLTNLLYVIYKKISSLIHFKGFKNAGSIIEGSWYGNDTIWRCIKDLNKIVIYADSKGTMHQTPQRNYLCLGDAIISSEGEGPMDGIPKYPGILICGNNPVYVDYVASGLIGFDYKKIPTIYEAFSNHYWTLSYHLPQNIKCISNRTQINKINLHFKPSSGWVGHIER